MSRPVRWSARKGGSAGKLQGDSERTIIDAPPFAVPRCAEPRIGVSTVGMGDVLSHAVVGAPGSLAIVADAIDTQRNDVIENVTLPCRIAGFIVRQFQNQLDVLANIGPANMAGYQPAVLRSRRLKRFVYQVDRFTNRLEGGLLACSMLHFQQRGPIVAESR